MKLCICITPQKYGGRLVPRLTEKGYNVTRLASTGGFLRQGNDTLLIGVSNEDVEQLEKDLQRVIKDIEKQKGWKAFGHKMTFFVVDGHDQLPIHL